MPPETQVDGNPPPQDPTGTLKDQSLGTTPTKEPGSEKETILGTKEGQTEADGKTLLTEKAKDAPAGAPEKYEDFKAPDGWSEKGWELDGDILKEATPLFKKLNLSQEQAQELVSFYATTSQKASEASTNGVLEQNEQWVAQVKADPEIGSKLPQVKATVSKAIDSLGPELSKSFREAMDFTGVGNHPGFIKAFYKLSQRLTEGGHVAGSAPSKLGQQRPGSAPESAAKALYPNLP